MNEDGNSIVQKGWICVKVCVCERQPAAGVDRVCEYVYECVLLLMCHAAPMP